MKIEYVTHVLVNAMVEWPDGTRTHKQVAMPIKDFAHLFVAALEARVAALEATVTSLFPSGRQLEHEALPPCCSSESRGGNQMSCTICGRNIEGERHGSAECIAHLRNEVDRLRRHLGDLCTAAAPISDVGLKELEAGRGLNRELAEHGEWVEIDSYVAVEVYQVMRRIELEAVGPTDD